MAHVAQGVSAVENGIGLSAALASRRNPGCRPARLARSGAAQGGTKHATVSGHHGFPFGQERRKRGLRGFDAGKKTKGRKQHIVVDTLGLLLAVVHSAGIQDRTGARAVLIRLFGIVTQLQKVYADGGYAGKLIAWSQAMFGWLVELVKRNETGKFVVLPKRWIVERTFASTLRKLKVRARALLDEAIAQAFNAVSLSDYGAIAREEEIDLIRGALLPRDRCR
ncbi:MAG: transposase [Azoarcus sp.]|jgi:transposase|nr:transposase [Azoarcus sp.]